MQQQFQKHYTREEANALLPQIRQWLARIAELRQTLEQSETRLAALTNRGEDIGGPVVNGWVRALLELNAVLGEFRSREIAVKDLERGLIDFPAIIGGREVFLCWEQDEESVEHWHELDTGYAGREKL